MDAAEFMGRQVQHYKNLNKQLTYLSVILFIMLISTFIWIIHDSRKSTSEKSSRHKSKKYKNKVKIN